MSLKDFKEQCQAEDSLIQDIKFLDSANQEYRNEEALSLYTILTTDKNKLSVKINENTQQFTGVQQTVVDHKADPWFDKCSSLGLNPTQSTTLSTFINQLQNQVKQGDGKVTGDISGVL